MLYRIAAVGRRARDPLVEATDAYLNRLNRYVRAEFFLVKDADTLAEGRALLAKTRDDDHVVALDERGLEQSTTALAQTLDGWTSRHSRVVFLLGGAAGHADAVRARANENWSLSRLTLPHRLAWVVLAEQLYRAHTLLRGEKYHRE